MGRASRALGALVLLVASSTVLVAAADPASAAATSAYVTKDGYNGTSVVTSDVTLFASTPGHAGLAIPSQGFSVSIWAPGGEDLHVGVYENTTEYLFGETPGTRPGLWAGNGFTASLGCAIPPEDPDPVERTGRFIVDELVSAPDGSITSIAFRFERHCDPYDEHVYGAIAYNSTVQYPTDRLGQNPIHVPSTPISTTGEIHPVTITNDGPVALTITDAALDGGDVAEFVFDATSCLDAPVAPGEACTLTLQLDAGDTIGPRSTTLVIHDDIAAPGGRGRRVPVQSKATTSFGEFTPLTPSRILDTRTGNGRSGVTTPLGPGASFDVQITGRGGVPSTGVSAVVMNVTVTGPTAPSHLTVYPTGLLRPEVSNLNYVAGQTVPNLVTVALGSAGRLRAFNNSGSTHVIFDVVGFYSSDSGPTGARFHPTYPTRIFDTRSGAGGVPARPIGAGQTLTFKVAGTLPVPANARAVVMNVTVTGPTHASHLTIYPNDVSRPDVSNLNYVPGLTVPNLVTVRLPSDGNVSFFNNSGSTHVLADVVGYYDDDRFTEAGRLISHAPTRVLDTREASPFPPPGAMWPASILELNFYGWPGIPETASLVTNITVTGPTSNGHLTVSPWPDVPLASNLNFAAGVTVPNAVMATIGGDGFNRFYIFNNAGYTHVIVDVFGRFTNSNYLILPDAAAQADPVPGEVQARVA